MICTKRKKKVADHRYNNMATRAIFHQLIAIFFFPSSAGSGAQLGGQTMARCLGACKKFDEENFPLFFCVSIHWVPG